MKCKEKACPFPADSSDGLCGRHREMFSVEEEDEQTAEKLFAEVQPRPNTGRRTIEGNRLDLANPAANAAFFEEEINTDKGGLFSREVAAERDKFQHILKIVRGRNNYRNSVRLRRCNSCWRPLGTEENKTLCRSCSDLAKACRLRREKRRRESGVCLQCGKGRVAIGRTYCAVCTKKRLDAQKQRRMKSIGLSLTARIYTSQEVAKLVGVCRATISNWLRQGLISPAVRRRRLYWTDKDVKVVRRFKLAYYGKKYTYKKVPSPVLCLRCYNKIQIPGARFCSRCIAKRKKRSELGLCLRCGATKVKISGRCVCGPCFAKREERRAANPGMCRCGKRPVVENRSQCFECKQKHLRFENLQYRRRKRARICVRCGKQKAVRNMVMCPACFKTHTQDRLRRSNKLRSLGLCITCGRSPSERGNFCENCRERTRNHHAAKRVSAAHKLRTKEEVNEKESDYRNEQSAGD